MAKILIADDSTVCRTVLSILLTNQGHEVRQAHDGKDAIGFLQQEGFDLILLDHEMPHASGMEVLRLVRAHSEIPAIIVSGTVSSKLSKEYEALKVAGIYGKPVNPKTLRDKIEELLVPEAAAKGTPVKTDREKAFENEIARVRNFPATLTLLGNATTPFREIISRIVDVAQYELTLPEAGGGELLESVPNDQVIVIPSAADLSQGAQSDLKAYISRPSHARVILCVRSSIEMLEDLGFSQTLLMRFGTRCLEIPDDVKV
jgi:CheY-like chemotaxis protein